MEKDVVCGMQVDPAKAAGTSEREAIGALHAEGIRVVMLTGDNRTTADAVARTLGIDHVEADVLPDQKATVVKGLQSKGERVAMTFSSVSVIGKCFEAQTDHSVSRLTKRRREIGPAIVAQSGNTIPSRYTRSVAWRHRIALVLLLAFAGMPVTGTLCAMVCDSAATQNTAHHGRDSKCAEPATPSPGPQLSGTSAHDCSTHDTSMRQVATTAVERIDLSARVLSAVVGSTSRAESVLLHDGWDSFAYTSPPGTDPPTVRPVVLRV